MSTFETRVIRLFWLAPLIFAGGCQPPAAEGYLEQKEGNGASGQVAVALSSPDVEGAVWAEVDGEDRLLYGQPGKPPMFAIACLTDGNVPTLRLTRFAPADPGAKAFMALVGNGHVARLKVDATRSGKGWLWQGQTPLANERLGALTGARALEATVPGAGTLKLNASQLPGRLIERCRAAARATEKAAKIASPVPAKGPA